MEKKFDYFKMCDDFDKAEFELDRYARKLSCKYELTEAKERELRCGYWRWNSLIMLQDFFDKSLGWITDDNNPAYPVEFERQVDFDRELEKRGIKSFDGFTDFVFENKDFFQDKWLADWWKDSVSPINNIVIRNLVGSWDAVFKKLELDGSDLTELNRENKLLGKIREAEIQLLRDTFYEVDKREMEYLFRNFKVAIDERLLNIKNKTKNKGDFSK